MNRGIPTIREKLAKVTQLDAEAKALRRKIIAMRPCLLQAKLERQAAKLEDLADEYYFQASDLTFTSEERKVFNEWQALRRNPKLV